MARSIPDILNAAADLLERPGAWVQNSFGRKGQCYCIRSAIGQASGAPDSSMGNDAAEAVVAAHIEGLETYTMPGAKIVVWNDAPGRTRDEVVSVLRRSSLAGLRSPGVGVQMRGDS